MYQYSTVFVGGLDGGNDTLDNFDIYPEKTEIWNLWKQAGVIMNGKSGKNGPK